MLEHRAGVQAAGTASMQRPHAVAHPFEQLGHRRLCAGHSTSIQQRASADRIARSTVARTNSTQISGWFVRAKVIGPRQRTTRRHQLGDPAVGVEKQRLGRHGAAHDEERHLQLVELHERRCLERHVSAERATFFPEHVLGAAAERVPPLVAEDEPVEVRGRVGSVRHPGQLDLPACRVAGRHWVRRRVPRRTGRQVHHGHKP